MVDIILGCLYYIHLYSIVTLEDSLAHTLSAKKRIRQNEKNRLKNRAYKTLIKNLEKKVLDAIAGSNKAEALEAYKTYAKKMDVICSKGILHANKVARKKSRINKRVNALQ